VPKPEDRSLRVFVSYAPEDSAFANELLKHLRFLERHGQIDTWSLDRVRAGSDWRREVREALERAHVALLLLSIDFLVSDFIQDVEVPNMLERRASQGLVVIPVLLRTCLWEVEPRVGNIKPLPASGKAIAAHEGDARDQVMTEVAKEIVRIAKERQTVVFCSTADKSPAAANEERSTSASRSLGLLDFFGLYAVRRYLYKAKAAEAKNMTGAIARALAAFMAREDADGNRASRFPPSAPPTPREVPRGKKANFDEKSWYHPTWLTIKFAMTEPVYFSYQIETAPDGRSAVVCASGDLAGDGKVLIFERAVTLDPAGNVVISPEVITREEFR
jgi:TIR domain